VPPKRENLEDIAKDRVQKMYDGVFEVGDSEEDDRFNEDDYFDDFN
jgi:hypothetical protein